MPRDIPFGARSPRPTWRLMVVGARDVTPRMREVSLIGDDLKAFSHRPGQDLVLSLPTVAGIARRHYTVRRFDSDELRLDIQFVLHGDAPAARWAREARHGDGLIAEGPRGRTTVSGEADWRLFTGDETALPGIAAMIESLPKGERAFAIVEVGGSRTSSRSRRRPSSRSSGCIATARRSRPAARWSRRWPTSSCRPASARPA